VPILSFSATSGPDSERSGASVNLAIRQTLADMGQTIAENFGGKIPNGKSFLAEMTK